MGAWQMLAPFCERSSAGVSSTSMKHRSWEGFACVALVSALMGCRGTSVDPDDELTDPDALNEGLDLSSYRFGMITPTGAEIFGNMLAWRAGQLSSKANVDKYPNGRMCANNVSKVYQWSSIDDRGRRLPELVRYSAEGVRNLIMNVRSERGAAFVALPKTSAEIVSTLNGFFGGHIPTGSVVAGCQSTACDSDPGNQHVGLMGEETIDQQGSFNTDAASFLPVLPRAGGWSAAPEWQNGLERSLRSSTNGRAPSAGETTTLWWIYHNNWLRPENMGLPNATTNRPAAEGNSKSFMVARQLLIKNHPRQWMATPWLRVTRDASGKISSADSVLPSLDDMDPRQYRVVIAVPKEIMDEVRGGRIGNRVAQSGSARAVVNGY